MLQSLEAEVAPAFTSYDPLDVRFIGTISGRYVLPDRRPSHGNAAVYACRLCSISTKRAVIVGPVTGMRGEMVTAHFGEFGMLTGRVGRRLPYGFAIELELTEAERNKLGRKIFWQRKKIHGNMPDKREHKRILLRDPRTVLTFADGSQMDGFVIDVSSSGIAISADIWPGVGTPMAVGQLVGRVVRFLDVGFALQFVKRQDVDTIEHLMAPPR